MSYCGHIPTFTLPLCWPQGHSMNTSRNPPQLLWETVLTLENLPLSCTNSCVCVCVCTRRSFLARWHHTIHSIKGAEESSPYHPALQAQRLLTVVSSISVSNSPVAFSQKQLMDRVACVRSFQPEATFISTLDICPLSFPLGCQVQTAHPPSPQS